ncbi:hypothetical protein CKO38_04120, partial [Rhodospirillum rubrum]
LEACRNALALAPDHPDLLAAQGALALAANDASQARAAFDHLVATTPADARGWHGLGRVHLALDEPADALLALDRATERAQAPLAGLAHDRALALRQLGRFDEALATLDLALERSPEDCALLTQKARVLERARRPRDAAEVAGQVLARHPDDATAQAILADALLTLGRPGEAIVPARACLERLLTPAATATPEALLDALERVGRCLRVLGRHGVWVEDSRRVCARLPNHPDALSALATALWWSGDFPGALVPLGRALALDPGHPTALWQSMLYPLRPVYATEAARAEALAEHRRAARDLARLPSQRLSSVDPLLIGYPFYAPYHGPLDLDAQRRIGATLCAAQADWAARHPVTPSSPAQSGRRGDDRKRVAFVSAFFRAHTVCKLFKAWIEDLDRERFHVSVLHLDERADEETAAIAALADRFHHLPRGGMAARAVLGDLAPQAIVYPELGMNNDTLRLAALRLAPVQAVAWGHPASSGLPTLDLFLSSDLMEPEGGEAAYSERLVRLPGLSIRYSPAFSVDDREEARRETRAALGLDEATPLLLSLQTHPKYAPADDALLAAIAARLPEARFALIDSRFPIPGTILRQRLDDAFRAQGVDPEGRILMRPPMPLEAYRRLNLAGDLFLDTPAWSGGNTTFEAIHCGLPILTLPGTTLWARHSAAILTALGIDETIARDREDYVDLAERLIGDPTWRAGLVARATAAKNALFTDRRPGAALSDVLCDAIDRASSSSPLAKDTPWPTAR